MWMHVPFIYNALASVDSGCWKELIKPRSKGFPTVTAFLRPFSRADPGGERDALALARGAEEATAAAGDSWSLPPRPVLPDKAGEGSPRRRSWAGPAANSGEGGGHGPRGTAAQGGRGPASPLPPALGLPRVAAAPPEGNSAAPENISIRSLGGCRTAGCLSLFLFPPSSPPSPRRLQTNAPQTPKLKLREAPAGAAPWPRRPRALPPSARPWRLGEQASTSGPTGRRIQTVLAERTGLSAREGGARSGWQMLERTAVVWQCSRPWRGIGPSVLKVGSGWHSTASTKC